MGSEEGNESGFQTRGAWGTQRAPLTNILGGHLDQESANL